MFIREVTKKNKGYEKTFVYHLLVESYRTAKGPRQRTLLHLGRLELDRKYWKALANRIEEIVSGQTSFAEPVPEEVERLAQHYASTLIDKHLRNQSETVSEASEEARTYETVALDSLKISDCRSIGGEWVSLSMLERLEFSEGLRRLGLSDQDIRLAHLLVIGRMVYPASEWATWQWARHRSAIGELLDLPLHRLSHNHLYRVGDILYAHKEALEAFFAARERDLFSLGSQIILYDLTNSYFESGEGASQLKRYGVSKEKRHDCPLVTLALVLNGHGFPLHSQVFAGNVREPETLFAVLEGLSQRLSVGEDGSPLPVVVIDAGIATEANLTALRERGYHYVVVSRSKPPAEIEARLSEGADFEVLRHSQDQHVEARLYRQAQESWLWVRSPRRSLKERSMQSKLQSRFEADLQAVLASLSKKRGTKRYDKVLERIGRLRQKHRRVSHYYEIEVEESQGQAVGLRWRLRDAKALDDRFSGRYFLRTSRTDLSAAEIWQLYVMLTDVEDSFRSMKSELGFRPNYHQRDDRIASHVFITVLAHHVVQCIQWYLHQKECYMRWNTIRELLSTQQRVTTSLETQDGKQVYLRTTSEPTDFQRFVCQALNIKSRPLPMKKTYM